MTIYTFTDWLGLVPIFVCLCFGMLGMVLSVACAAVFILTRQPYAGIICLAILVVKVADWKGDKVTPQRQ